MKNVWKGLRSRWQLLVLLLCTVMASCDPPRNHEPGPEPQQEQKAYNLSYGPDTRNKLDIYLPANRDNNTPFVLLIHGGGWVSGDKADMNALQDSLMKRGIASASMSYRYAGSQVHYTELMQDVAAAVTFCYGKHTEWNTRADKYIIGGVSAGAHMALLYAYNYDATNRISAVVSAVGPTDITQTDWLNYSILVGLNDEIGNMVGATYALGQPLDPAFAAASPRLHIKNVPTLMLHGDADLVVFYSQSQLLNADLATAGIPHKLVTIPGANHDLGVANPVILQQLLTEISSWCTTYGR